MPYDPRLTVTRAAKYLGTSARQLRRYCRQGKVDGAEHFGANATWKIPLSTLRRLRSEPFDPTALDGIDLSDPTDPASHDGDPPAQGKVES